MTQAQYVLNLKQSLETLREGTAWLKRSYEKCRRIGVKSAYTAEEFDIYETLSGRFARVSDILIQKVFRSIDKVEFEEKGTMIDVINRAHKRGLISSVEEIRVMRELRNSIAHEYMTKGLPELFEETLRYTPALFKIIDEVNNYSSRYT